RTRDSPLGSPHESWLFPYTTLFRSVDPERLAGGVVEAGLAAEIEPGPIRVVHGEVDPEVSEDQHPAGVRESCPEHLLVLSPPNHGPEDRAALGQLGGCEVHPVGALDRAGTRTGPA